MKIKGTIGQYPIDLEIEDDIDYSKINELISRISEDYKNKLETDRAKALASIYKKKENTKKIDSFIQTAFWRNLKQC